jgi:hypothetical protein
MSNALDVVTGAFSYIGKYIARHLLDSGRQVRTITTHPDKEFEELVALIGAKMGRNVRLVHLPPSLGIFLGQIIGWFVRDVVLTMDEAKGLMDSLLCSGDAPNGETRFSEWLNANADSLGTSYSSELERHFRWKKARE